MVTHVQLRGLIPPGLNDTGRQEEEGGRARAGRPPLSSSSSGFSQDLGKGSANQKAERKMLFLTCPPPPSPLSVPFSDSCYAPPSRSGWKRGRGRGQEAGSEPQRARENELTFEERCCHQGPGAPDGWIMYVPLHPWISPRRSTGLVGRQGATTRCEVESCKWIATPLAYVPLLKYCTCMGMLGT